MNVFVLGLDDLNAEMLSKLPDAEQCRFHRLLEPDDLRSDDINLEALLADAERTLYAFDGTIDAIVGYWDFPVSSLVPILAERFGTTAPSLEAVVKCEHKYWSRMAQREVITEQPGFDIVDPQHATRPPAHLRYPMWAKPVKSAGSALAFHVHNDDEFEQAMADISAGIDRLGEPFQHILDRLDPPAGIAASGQACLVEEDVTGIQATVEGFVQGERVVVYGIVSSISYPGRESFLRFQYPSTLPPAVTERLTDIATRVIAHMGLDNSTFNIEFFWHEDSDEIHLLEINPRHSQSHARLFWMVDGLPNHHAMLRLALGEDPNLPHGKGDYQVAAKWFLRRFSDGRVLRAPTADDVAQVESEVPGTLIRIAAQEGQQLSDMARQDSYSYGLADIYIGADSEDELIEKYEWCVEALPYEFDQDDGGR